MPSSLTKIIMKSIAEVYDNPDGTSSWVINMQMWGGNIDQAIEQNFQVTVAVDDDTISQIATKIAAAARAYATQNGITIQANKIYLNSYTGF